MSFKLKSKYKPAGDQPKAINSLVNGLNEGKENQVLLGVTGSGKTFSIANVIAQTDRTTIVLSHNKTLAGQLYSELKSFFPNDRVEYFISNFDYYRPEAYMPSSDTYINKTSKTNQDIEAMRMSTANALVSGERTIVVASVASIYGAQNPIEYANLFFELRMGQLINRDDLLLKLVHRGYTRNDIDNKPGTFRARGDVIEIAPSFTSDFFYRIEQFGEEIEGIKKVDYLTGEILKVFSNGITIFPAQAYMTRKEVVEKAIKTIEKELKEQIENFKSKNLLLEAQRIEQRTLADIDSLKEYGIVSGIENYSRHFEERKAGQRPPTILDYIVYNSKKRNTKPLMIIDESHMMIPQLNAMYNGDRARKQNLVDYGFRLPSALDNRPLKFKEFEKDFDFVQKIFVSATPSEYEIDKSHGEIVPQIVRPTGLLDPTIEIVPIKGQVEDIFDRLQKIKKNKSRALILTTTKRMAEELTNFLQLRGEKIAYIHSDFKTFQRDEIIRKLRIGVYDAIIGINLIREGIDIPEVSEVLILDADKESFFRSTKSLIQIIGRAARNENGNVVMYADNETKSMKEAIDETNRRRQIQIDYNTKNNIKPKTIQKEIPEPLNPEQEKSIDFLLDENISEKDRLLKISQNQDSIKKEIERIRGRMFKASREMNFEKAAQLRDLILELETYIT